MRSLSRYQKVKSREHRRRRMVREKEKKKKKSQNRERESEPGARENRRDERRAGPRASCVLCPYPESGCAEHPLGEVALICRRAGCRVQSWLDGSRAERGIKPSSREAGGRKSDSVTCISLWKNTTSCPSAAWPFRETYNTIQENAARLSVVSVNILTWG